MGNIRGRGLFNAKYKTEALFKNYKRLHKETKLIRSKFNSVLSDINEAIFKEIIDNNFELIMPYNLGKKRIRKTKIKLKLDENGELDINRSHLIIDWASTNKLWEEDPEAKANKTFIYLTNAHTNGYRFNFYWCKKVAVKRRVLNLSVMSFRATKNTRQYLRDRLKNPFTNMDYFENVNEKPIRKEKK